MFEALVQSLHLFGVDNPEEIGEDYSRTKERVFCHVLQKERYLALREQFSLPVSYLPHPLLFAESSIKKATPPLCLVLRKRTQLEPKEITALARAQGYRVATIDDAQLGVREKRRAYREAAVVIACSLADEWSEVLLCASKTPFLISNIKSKIAFDYLSSSGVAEKVLDFSPAGLRSLIINHALFCANASRALEQLLNLVSWKVHTPTSYNTKGYALIDANKLTGEAVLTPWVAVITDPSILERDELKASRVLCAGVVTATGNKYKGWPACATLTSSLFKSWSGQILMVCSDGTCVRYNLQTKRGTQTAFSFEANEILILEVFDRELAEQAIRLGVPFVSAPSEALPSSLLDYEGICNVKFLPVEVQRLLTPQFVAKIATQTFTVRNALLLAEI